MTAEIRLEESSLEHMTKQPRGLRYALFCDEVLRGPIQSDCDSKKKLGHVGDYGNYPDAKADALAHPHAVLIRFYPDHETRIPSKDFLEELRKPMIVQDLHYY